MVENTLNFLMDKHFDSGNIIEDRHYCALISSDKKHTLYGKER